MRLSDGTYTEIITGELKAGQEIITDSLNNKKTGSSSRPPGFMH